MPSLVRKARRLLDRANARLDAAGGVAIRAAASVPADPVEYARTVLYLEPWEAQRKIADALLKPPYRVAVPSGHNTGKTWTAAWLANWWFDRHPGESCVITTAPTFPHTAQVLWREIRLMRARGNLPGKFSGRMKPQLWDHENHFAVGMTAESGEAWTGRHLKHMLFIFDEAVGVDSIYWETTRTMFKADGNHGWLVIGNPTDTASQMFLECGLTNPDGSPVWAVIPLSSLDHPNIVRQLAGQEPLIPEAVTLSQVDEWVRDFADVVPKDEATAEDLEWRPGSGQWHRPSPVFQARCLGQWPSQGTNGVWSEAAWAAATRPCPECKSMKPITDCPACLSRVIRRLPEIGVDVAWKGDDYTAFVVRCGPVALHCERHNGWGGPQIVGRAKELARTWARWATSLRHVNEAPIANKQIRIKVDSDGMGGLGVVSWAQPGWEEDFSFQGVGAGTKASASDRYPNKRSELWFNVVERAKVWQLDLSRLPKQELERCRQQAMTPLWKVDAAGRRVVEPKDKTKERMRGSPDEMDALNLAFAEYSDGGPVVILGKPRGEVDAAAQRGWYGKAQQKGKR